MAISENEFLGIEKRIASFKHVFGKLMLDPEKGMDWDVIEGGHQIYSSELIANEVPFEGGSSVSHSLVRTWTNSSTGTSNLWTNGYFVTSSQSGNSDIEKISIPLVKINSTNDHAYVAYISDSPSSNGRSAIGTIAADGSKRLKNWISPVRYGAGYAVNLYQSNAQQTAPDYTKPIQTSNAGVYGGSIFDYYQGVLYLAQKSNDTAPDVSGFEFPIWAEGYRYIGPTGSAAPGSGGGGGITSITSTTDTNLAWDSTTNELTIGANTKTIDINEVSPFRRLYFNQNFAKDNERLYSSIIISQSGDSKGLPYTATGSNNKSNNQLHIHTIHMQAGKGYAINFKAPGTASGNTLPDEYYFNHDKPNQLDKLISDTPGMLFTASYQKGNKSIKLVSPIDSLRTAQTQLGVTYYPTRFAYKNALWRGPSNNPLDFDPSNKSAEQIANGLKDLINASCSQHAWATVSATGSNWELKVEQVYSGYNYWDKTIQYTGSDVGITHANIYTGSNSDWNFGWTYTQNLLGPNQNQWWGDYTNTSVPGNSSLGSWVNLAVNSVLSVPGASAGGFGLYDITFPNPAKFYKTNGDTGNPVDFISRNGWGLGTLGISPIWLDITSSGTPYGLDTTLVNGQIGQQNPTHKSITWGISNWLTSMDIVEQIGTNYYNSSTTQKSLDMGKATFQQSFLNVANFVFDDGVLPYLQINKNVYDSVTDVNFPYGASVKSITSHSVTESIISGSFTGVYEKSPQGILSVDLITNNPINYRYFNSNIFNPESTESQEIAGPISFLSSISSSGVVSASGFYINGIEFTGSSGGTGSGLVTSLTTTGTSGTASLSSGVLNIPNYDVYTDTTFIIQGDGTNYLFTGSGFTSIASDPELYLIRGKTYKFINAASSHPFRIQSIPNGSTGSAYTSGITNNDVTSGTLIFEVPYNAPDTLYYQCTSHAAMGGKINILKNVTDYYTQAQTTALLGFKASVAQLNASSSILQGNINSKLDASWTQNAQITGTLDVTSAPGTIKSLVASSSLFTGGYFDGTDITASGNISSSGYVSASSFIGNGTQLTGVQPSGNYLVSGTNISVTSLTTTGRTKLGDQLTDKHEITGSVEVTGSFKANKGKFGSGTVLLEWDEPGQISGSGNFRAGGNAVIKNALSSGPAILGISGSEKAAYNTGKLDDFFKATGENHYSLYVRNGLTIVGSHIVPDRPHAFDLGTKKFPFRDLHLDKSSIIFHSGSPEESGSDKPELGRLSINTASLSAEFTSGSELIKVRAGEFNLGGGIGATGDNASIQITASSNGQGFIAVNANAQGQRSTILRAEYYQLSGDMNMGSITQKGSGSFAILLDADQAKSDAKFVVESNNPVPGVGSRLFHVSESGEVRSHGYLTVSQSLEVGTSVTAQSFTGSLTNMTGTIDGGTF